MTDGPIPDWLYTPPTKFLASPVTTRAQKLPFGDLRWEDFERLCARLERTRADLECCRLYGVSGQRQEGIDLYSRRRSATKYRVLQCKRVEDFTAAKIRKAVEKFLSGSWSTKAEAFVLCTQESLRRTEMAKEIETQRAVLDSRGVTFEPWDADELAVLLKSQPEIVIDFFGREWALEFCGPEPLGTLSPPEELWSSVRELLEGEISYADQECARISGRCVDEIFVARHFAEWEGTQKEEAENEKGAAANRSSWADVMAELEEHKAVVVLGDPGFGKTIALLQEVQSRCRCALRTLDEQPPGSTDFSFGVYLHADHLAQGLVSGLGGAEC